MIKKSIALLLTAVGLLSGPASAQEYPDKPIRIIVPFGPGGGTDTVTRHVLPRLREALGGQTIIIENKPGSGTILGTESVARAKADGYTLLVTAAESVTMNQSLYNSLSYDPIKDFVPISRLATSHLIYVANPKLPVKTLAELVAYAKQNPMTINYGSGATSARVYIQQLADETGIKMQFVPYSGGAPALAALLNNEVQLVAADLPTFAAPILDGRLVGLGVTGPVRSPKLPNVPTMKEAGFPALEGPIWWGMFAPAGTPPAIVSKLQAAVGKALSHEDTRQAILAMGSEPAPTTSEELTEIIKRESAKWAPIIKNANIRMN